MRQRSGDESSRRTPPSMTRHQLRQWFTVAILFLLTLAISHVSSNLLDLHWSSFVGYESPYSFDLPATEETEGISTRVVLVVVDSLRRDSIDILPSWEKLEREGAVLQLRGTIPSETVPSWATIVTGTDPAVHGATTGLTSGPLPVDHLAASVRRADYPVHFAGNRLWEGLIGEHIDAPHYQFVDPLSDPGSIPDERSTRAVISELERGEEGLFLLNLTTLRNVALRQGAARREERPTPYERRLGEHDELLMDLLEALDLTEDTLLITASHGSVSRGGQGGSESAVLDIPAVAVGRGIIPGTQTEGKLRDLAATSAVLLGTGIPAHSTGAPLLDILEMTEEERLHAAETALSSQMSFYREKLKALDGRERIPDISALSQWSDMPQYSAELRAASQAQVQERLASDRTQRLEVLLVTLAAAALWAGITYARGHRAALLGVLLTLLLGFGLILAMGGRFSLTDFRSTEHFAVWFRGMRAHGILLAGSLGMAAGLLTGRRGSYTRPQLFSTALHTLSSGMIALMLFAGAYTYWFGYSATWAPPDGAMMVANLSALVFVTAMGQFSVLALGLSWLGAVLTVNWWLD